MLTKQIFKVAQTKCILHLQALSAITKLTRNYLLKVDIRLYLAIFENGLLKSPLRL